MARCSSEMKRALKLAAHERGITEAEIMRVALAREIGL